MLARGVQGAGVAVRREVGARRRRGQIASAAAAVVVVVPTNPAPSAAAEPSTATKVLLLLERRRPVDRRPARPRVLQARHPARPVRVAQYPRVGVVHAEQLVDLADLERGRELLSEAEEVALGEGGGAYEPGQGAVGGALGGDASSGGEAAFFVVVGGWGKRKRERARERQRKEK